MIWKFDPETLTFTTQNVKPWLLISKPKLLPSNELMIPLVTLEKLDQACSDPSVLENLPYIIL